MGSGENVRAGVERCFGVRDMGQKPERDSGSREHLFFKTGAITSCLHASGNDLVQRRTGHGPYRREKMWKQQPQAKATCKGCNISGRRWGGGGERRAVAGKGVC